MLHSDSFRSITKMTKAVAEEICDGKLVLVHEGGYAESYVPFCGLAVMEEISEIKTNVVDPAKDFIELQQPNQEFNQFQKNKIDQWVKDFSLDQPI